MPPAAGGLRPPDPPPGEKIQGVLARIGFGVGEKASRAFDGRRWDTAPDRFLGGGSRVQKGGHFDKVALPSALTGALAGGVGQGRIGLVGQKQPGQGGRIVPVDHPLVEGARLCGPQDMQGLVPLRAVPIGIGSGFQQIP